MQHNHIVKVDQQRLERLLSGTVHLRSGVGSGINGQFDACFMNAAHWLDGGDGTSDAPECVDPVIRGFGIRLNDAPRFASFRDDLIPFTPKVLGTNVGPELTEKRRFMCIDWAIRVITPLSFEAWAEKSPKHAVTALQHAQSLRAVPHIYDLETAWIGRDVVLRAKRAAAYADAAYAAAAAAYAYAAAATYADADAYAAADAAYAAAYAAADAAADASRDAAYAAYAYADVAYAAAYAYADAATYADAADARRIWGESLRFLQELIDAQ